MFFRPARWQVFTEYELVDSAGHSHRIDRLLVDQDRVTVLDFKTSRKEDVEQDITQVRRYKELLAGLFPGHTVLGKLVFVREREVVDV